MVENSKHLTVPPFIERIFVSVEGLRGAINKARENLSLVAEGVIDKDAILNHFKDYEEILSKQEKFAHQLIVAVQSNNTEGVHRYCRLINGMSVMIRDDAKEMSRIINAVHEESSRDAI